jgi:hypothetical protein
MDHWSEGHKVSKNKAYWLASRKRLSLSKIFWCKEKKSWLTGLVVAKKSFQELNLV